MRANVAKLETSACFVGDKLELKVYGFNNKLAVLLSKIISIARSFLPTDDRFKVIKEDLKRILKNTNMKPLSHSSYLRLQVMWERFYDADERLLYLNDLLLDDLKAFIPALRSQDDLDDASFYRSGLLAKLLEKDPSLSYESNRFWTEVVDKRYTFNLSKMEAEELKNISKNDVINWYKVYLKQSSPKFRRDSIRVWGCNTDMKDFEALALPKSGQLITAPEGFKISSEFYPYLC